MAAVERAFTKSVIRKGSFSAAEIENYKEALRQPGALTSAINYYRANINRLASRGSNALPSNERTRVPTLFIFAERDFAILPETVRGVADYVDAPFREVRIKDSGHWVQNEAADEVNAALIEFLKADFAVELGKTSHG